MGLKPPGSFLFVFFGGLKWLRAGPFTPGRFCPLAAHLYSTILCCFFPRSQRVYRRHPQTMYSKYTQKGTWGGEGGPGIRPFVAAWNPPNSLFSLQTAGRRRLRPRTQRRYSPAKRPLAVQPGPAPVRRYSSSLEASRTAAVLQQTDSCTACNPTTLPCQEAPR